METLTIQLPEGAEGKKIKAVLKALGVSFGKAKNGVAKQKKKDKPYDPEFVAKIKQGERDIKDGKGIRMTLDEIWK